jgi:transposase-like protein
MCSDYVHDSEKILQSKLVFYIIISEHLFGGNIMAKVEEFNLVEFQRKFNTEEACEKYLFEQRWPKGFKCPKCGFDEFYYISTRKLYECKKCAHQTSITAGTVMNRSKLNLTVWFWTIYLVSNDKRGRSALAISQLLELNYRTAWRLLHKIRHAMSERDASYQLAGFVEMDDAYFGAPRPKTDGRGTTKAKVAIALSLNENGKPQYARMKVIEAVSTDEIKKVAEECILKGSTVSTDGHSSYLKLKENYTHRYQNYYESDNAVFLKWLHVITGNAKMYILGTYHGLEDKFLQAYLDELCYRFNRRFSTKQLFGRLLNVCILGTYYIVPEPSA